ncbi:hypothetical protein CHLNCDRAFT_142687 [Chlorella variabilis]|uniref:Interferon-related developmental regulator N-terminal domain-containing protein n=1 Tax=Chlorella variabilis TaxID=554065 RepID=E1ZA10_CHLVA|nr:hypothetical protein CHLNCDRAFT_142687 [Chlorella variabilis]EFN57609.1 hypothetical protein CHLNCDRAFT_142687 [Chlorella variabilis]|eukprot:XP_005849711.1 hypothetical protein CHLNCDRAFT_142687 [Chlorella variabilis]
MGRRKSSTAGSEHDTESLGSLEYGSRASGGGRRAQREPGFEEELVEVDPFDTAVEQLYEKRCEEGLGVVGYAATDELHSAWRSSRIAACMNVSGVQGYNAEDTLTQLFLSSIRKGKESEACLAAKALGLHVTTLGASTASEGIYQELLNGSDVDVRAATGEGVALLWLMGDLSSLPESPRPSRSSSNATNTYNSLVAMAVGSPRTPRIAAAMAAFGSPGNGAASASRNDKQGPAAWSEMQLTAATTEQDGYGAALQQERQAQQQQQQSHPAVADECVWGEEEEEEEEVDSLEAIVERMRDLAKNRGHASRLNKGDRATSRGTFRDLLAIIEGEYVPEQKIKLRHGDLLLVSGLPDNIRLNYLRAYLADAFQSHLQSNELLHEVFHFQPAVEPEEKLTPLEKRMFRSKSSCDVRDRTELRRQERSQMANYRHGSLADY